MPATTYNFPRRDPTQTYANPVTQQRVDNMYSKYRGWGLGQPMSNTAPKVPTQPDFIRDGALGFGVKPQPQPSIPNNPFKNQNPSPIPMNWMDVVNQSLKGYKSPNTWFKT